MLGKLQSHGLICEDFVTSLNYCLGFLKADILEMCAVPLIMYAIQHYLSNAGSLILILFIIVPTIGGTPVSHTYIWQ
jgi:membrane protein required for beta-lactamase induction